MSSRPRKIPVVLLALVAVFALSACGDSHSRVTTGTYAGEGGAAAPYLNVGPLSYQVQVSRELNPANAEDAAYLQGLTPAEAHLAPGEEWFAVFIQVYNNTSQERQAANTFKIYDTQGSTYSPVMLDESNPFAYRGGLVPTESQLPEPGTIADDVGAQGALLLYKVQLASLENRPWELRIVDPTDASQTATAELDV
ncbi:MAG TPA: hypothetical protein VIJ66_01845 [Solirubrobacteraceae bacterium]